MRSVIAVLLFAVTSAAAFTQQTNLVAIFPGAPQDLDSGPLTFNLIPKEPGARAGKIWVRYADDGLHIFGKVQASERDVRWPVEKKDMLASDHVEIWLSTAASVDMPPIGYGNQFGETALKTIADCVPVENGGGPGDPRTPDVVACQRWYNNQLEYRRLFERLFTRQWLASCSSEPNSSHVYFEDYATTAWNTLSAEFFSDELPEALKPKANDGIASQFNFDYAAPPPGGAGTNPQGKPIVTGYSFSFVIPWNAFPPTAELNLHYLWLMVDVFTHAPDGKKMGALSTTAPERVWGKPSTFNHIILNVPRRYSITPCEAAPMQSDLYGNPHPAWYFPTSGVEPLYLANTFDIENPAGGYMYSPSGVSPIASTEEHFWKSLPDGSFVCGPELGYRNGKVAATSSFVVDKDHLDLKTLDNGTLLVRSGPTMTIQNPGFGSGQCGACDVEMMQMYVISPSGNITKALDLSDRIQGNSGDPNAVDYGFSNDWSTITYYLEYPDDPNDFSDRTKAHASSVTYCLRDLKYEECGKSDKAKMPEPPNFKTPPDAQ